MTQANNCACARPSKGKGVPGGMIKVTEHVIVSVPFPRQMFQVNVIENGVLTRKGVVRYLFAGSWIEAAELLRRWQPWREVVVSASGVKGSADRLPASAGAAAA